MTAEKQPSARQTIVLVHGAFAESASWNDVISTLRTHGFPVIALANPLRGVTYDSAYLASLLKTIAGPVVLVGHSYGGMLISNAATGNPNVEALVYVAAFAPEAGESAADLSGRFPGSTLGETLMPVPLPEGSTDLYIRQELFHAQFCADVPESEARRMAAAQRPVAELALNETPASPPGRASPPGSSSATSTRTSRWPPSASWPSAPGLARRSRSRAPPTPSVSPTPTRWPS